MNFRALTWPQVVLVLGAGALILVAYRLFGAETATVFALVTHALAAMSSGGPPAPPAVRSEGAIATPAPRKDPPATPFVAALLFAIGLMGCVAWTAPDVQRLRTGERKLDVCEDFATSDAGADANADDLVARFRACRAEAGLP